MNTKIINLGLMIIWLMICIGLLTRDYWMPAGLKNEVSGPNTPLVISITAVLAVWNLMRFWVAQRFPKSPRVSPSPEAQEYRRRIRSQLGDDPRVTDPQFRFDDSSDRSEQNP